MKLRIEKEIYGGDGLARLESGRAVFVPYVLVGEGVEADLLDGRDGTARARLIRVEEAAPGRTLPGCRHFGQCGGCQYQHAAYDAQLAIKHDILSETMERAGLRDRPRIEVHAGKPWEYRNRIRLRVERDSKGAIRFGYNFRETREFLPIEECPIAASLLWRAASALEDLGSRDPMCARWLGGSSSVELFATPDEQSLQITFYLRGQAAAGFAGFCEKIRARVPELAGAGAMPATKDKAELLSDPTWGRAGLQYAAANRQYWVSRGGFFQVNRFLVDELIHIVTYGRAGALAWDLFAGVGLFSRVLADRFEQVIAVEANAAAIRDLGTVKVVNLRGVAVSAVEFLRRAVVERERPELVVMDPPRAGAGAEVCELLARLQVPQIVYVSCDPSTLARDLRVMVDSGYNLAELHLVDLFPQTFHLETVAVLDRSAR